MLVLIKKEEEAKAELERIEKEKEKEKLAAEKKEGDEPLKTIEIKTNLNEIKEENDSFANDSFVTKKRERKGLTKYDIAKLKKEFNPIKALAKELRKIIERNKKGT